MESLLDFVKALPLVQTAMFQKSSLEEETVSDAQANLDHQDSLCQLLEEVACLQKSLQKKIEVHRLLHDQITEMSKPVEIEYVLEHLYKGKRASFVESEKLAKNPSEFISKLESFIELRTLHHLRAAKIERLQEKQ
jgi:hypothetical protein